MEANKPLPVPKVIAPKASLETIRPVSPKRVYLMAPSVPRDRLEHGTSRKHLPHRGSTPLLRNKTMTVKNTSVYGIYRNRAQAEHAVERLSAKGFSNNDISVLMPDPHSTREFAVEKNTKAPEGTATGAVGGGVIGGALGLLAGIGALTIPGIGPMIAAGPIVSTLAGIGAGGAVGGLLGALAGLGVPEYEAKRYEGHVKDG